jgi:two-component system, NtrC family, sensor kinase
VISGSPTDVQRVFDTIVRNAVRLSGASWGVVTRVEAGLITFVAHHNLDANVLARMRRTWPRSVDDRGPTAGVVARGELFRAADLEAEDYGLLPEVAAEFRARGIRSMLIVPMVRESHVVGTINLTHQAVGAFSDADVALITTFADQAVIAIENVRLFTELQEKNRVITEALEQQTATSELLRVIGSSATDVQPVFEAIATNAVTLCGAAYAVVFRFDGDMVSVVAHDNVDPPALEALHQIWPRRPDRSALVGRTIIDRSVLHIADVTAEPAFTLSAALQPVFPIRTFLGVPILRDGASIGAIALSRREVAPFSDRQIELVRTFADQAVIAIENVRLFNETKEALERQTATSEILRVISSSPTDVQPVFDAVAASAARLCEAIDAAIFRVDGDVLRLVAHQGAIPAHAPLQGPPLVGNPSGAGRPRRPDHPRHLRAGRGP